MKFYIEILNDNGSSMKCNTKEDFLKEISLMIDNCIANGGKFFDVQIDSDASCFYHKRENDRIDDILFARYGMIQRRRSAHESIKRNQKGRSHKKNEDA